MVYKMNNEMRLLNDDKYIYLMVIIHLKKVCKFQLNCNNTPRFLQFFCDFIYIVESIIKRYLNYY